MKKLFILSCLTCIFFIACNSEPKVKAPEVVDAKFTSLYPAATNVKWEQEDSLYEASFVVADVEKSVAFLVDGTVHVMETEIDPTVLPQTIKDYIAQQVPGKTIDGAGMIIFADGISQYEAEVEKKDYLFDAAGQFIRVEEEKNDD